VNPRGSPLSGYARAKGLVALGHRLRGARDGVRHVEVPDARAQRRGRERARAGRRVREAELGELGGGELDGDAARVGEVRRDGGHALAHALDGVVGKGLAEYLQKRGGQGGKGKKAD